MSLEIWRDIPKFEGVYQVSNMGNIKRLPYTRIQHNGGTYEVKERLLKSKKKDIFAVSLKNEGYERNFVVNRLVYSIFNDVKLQRNHLIIPKDGNKLNCKLYNLKLITKRNFVAAKMTNSSGYTGVTSGDEYGQFTARIYFEGVEVSLYTSKNKKECNKIYQLAKSYLEDYDRKKTEILSSYSNNRLMNKSVKI